MSSSRSNTATTPTDTNLSELRSDTWGAGSEESTANVLLWVGFWFPAILDPPSSCHPFLLSSYLKSLLCILNFLKKFLLDFIIAITWFTTQDKLKVNASLRVFPDARTLAQCHPLSCHQQ